MADHDIDSEQDKLRSEVSDCLIRADKEQVNGVFEVLENDGFEESPGGFRSQREERSEAMGKIVDSLRVS
jgi:hypothetical protein